MNLESAKAKLGRDGGLSWGGGQGEGGVEVEAQVSISGHLLLYELFLKL